MSEEAGTIHRVLIVGRTDNDTLLAIKVDAEVDQSTGIPYGPGALAINVQDQHTSPILLPLHNDLQADLEFDGLPGVDDWTITLVAGHGYTGAAGEQIEILEGPIIQYADVVGYAANVLTLSEKIYYPFTAAAAITRVSDEMAVDGSGTRQEFHAHPPVGAKYDITGIRVSMICTTEPDDSKFGDVAELTRGLYLAIRLAEGASFPLGTFRNNGDLARVAGTVEYEDKAGGGYHSVRATGAIRRDWGVAIRIRGDVASQAYPHDEIHGIVQDDVDSLLSLRVVAYGHVVQ